jgi:hypothetical protein
MVGIIAFHVVMLLLALSIVSRVAPEQSVSNMIGYLHKAIGITTPSFEQSRMVAVIWLSSVVLIVDGCLFLLLFIVGLSSSGLSTSR